MPAVPLLLLLLLLLVAPGRAYWQMGHVLAAQIAFEGLSDVERSRSDLYAAEKSLFGFAPNLVESATWADDIKTMGLTAFNNWHYTDTPLVRDGVAAPVPHAGDLTWALGEMLASYKSARATPGSRSFALRMLAHLIGDATQPLHGATLYSKQFPHGDQGGNLFNVTYQGKPTNLHSFWDSGAFRLDGAISQPITTKQLSYVLSTAADIIQKHPRSSFSNEDLFFDPAAWLQQSFDNAVQYVYVNNTLQVGATLTDDYAEAAYALTERNLALSGYRLQYVIQKYNDVTAPKLPGLGVSWAAIVGLTATATLVLGYVAGIMTYYIWQKRKKRVKFLREIERDPEESDLLVGQGALEY